jgi:ferrous iron transport protein A
MADNLKTMSLINMAVGNRGRVIGFEHSNALYRKKLLAMGLTRGTEFSINRFAPLGDPIEIEVRGYNLSLRKQEAKVLLVEGTN